MAIKTVVLLIITRWREVVAVVHTGAGWFCDEVIVREVTDTDSRSFYFPCRQWLDRGKSDRLIERTLLAQQPPTLVEEQSEVAEEEPKTKPSKFCVFVFNYKNSSLSVFVI